MVRGSVGRAGAGEGARPRLAGAVWALGAGLLAVITWVALGRLFGSIPAPDLGTTLGSIGELVGGTTVAGGGLFLVHRWVRRLSPSPKRVLLAGLVLTAMLRLAAIVWVHPSLVSDWRYYHDLAVSIANGGTWFADVPTGYPLMLAPLYALLGATPIFGEILNLGFALWTAAMVYIIAGTRFGPQAAAAAIYLFAIFPSQILMSTVLGTEVAYAAFVATAVAVAVVPADNSWRWTVALGVVLGLSQYVRSTSMLLLPAAVVLSWLRLRSGWTVAARTAVVVLVFLVVMIPAVVANLVAGAGPSVTTSRYGGWSLLIGLNTRSVGRYNVDDIQLVGLTPGTVAWDRRASELAIERLASNGLANVDLAMKKFPVFWGGEDYGAGWTAVPLWDLGQPVGRFELITSQLVYAGVLLLAVAGVVVGRRTWRQPTELLILMVAMSVAVLHTFLEIQPRYHAYVIPLLCVLAGGAIAGGTVGVPRSLQCASSARLARVRRTGLTR